MPIGLYRWRHTHEDQRGYSPHTCSILHNERVERALTAPPTDWMHIPATLFMKQGCALWCMSWCTSFLLKCSKSPAGACLLGPLRYSACYLTVEQRSLTDAEIERRERTREAQIPANPDLNSSLIFTTAKVQYQPLFSLSMKHVSYFIKRYTSVMSTDIFCSTIYGNV